MENHTVLIESVVKSHTLGVSLKKVAKKPTKVVNRPKDVVLSPAEKDRLDIDLETSKREQAGTRTPGQTEKLIVDLAMKQYKDYQDYYGDEIRHAKDDIAFCIDADHWTVDGKDIKAERAKDYRLSLTMNRAPGFIDNVTGDVRQNMPRIKYSPVDSKTDPKLADIYNAAIRYMQSISRAHRQITPAFEQACTGGYPGWVQMVTEYADNKSKEQEIYIRFVPGQFGPALDHNAVCMDEPGKGGPKWGHIPEFLTWSEFNDLYPEATAKSWDSVKDSSTDNLFTQAGVTVMSYYKAVPTHDTLHEFPGKDLMLASSEEYRLHMEASPDAKSTWSRAVKDWRIDHYVMTGSEILAGPEPWAGKFIPLIPLEGKYFIDNGKKKYRSIYRNAKDANRIENWVLSEAIGLLADEPYVGSPEMIEGHETMWQTKNKKQFGFLYAKPDSSGGMPRKEDNSQKLSGLFRALPQFIDNEKALAAIYNASMGAASNETSGRAINARDAQSNTTNFAFMDNGIIAPEEYIAMQFADLFPKIYDYEKTLKIMGEDDRDAGEVTLNATEPNPDNLGEVQTKHIFKDKDGDTVEVLYSNLADARFNITVEVGPGFKTQRMEALDAVVRMSQGNQVFSEASSGNAAALLDIPDADKIAERCEFILSKKYQGIDQVGKQAGGDKVQAKIKQAVEQFQQELAPKMQQLEQNMQTTNQALVQKTEENAMLKAQVTQATQGMKDAARKYELREMENDLKLREHKLEMRESARGIVEEGGNVLRENESLRQEITDLQRQIAALSESVEKLIPGGE
jgi:hypothetical protein